MLTNGADAESSTVEFTEPASQGLTLRLRSSPDCFAKEFRASETRPPLEYVSTFLTLTRGQNTSIKLPSLPNKSDVRLVLSTRHSSRSRRSDQLPVAYVITPTYTRFTQKVDLLRLCYTLMHVPRVHWIVVEDSAEKTATVAEILANCRGPSVTHLSAKATQMTTHRGIAQRNAALDWIRRCVQPTPQGGGVYFADDDNTYDLLVFEAVRWTSKVSIWPVGFPGAVLWEGPACSNNKIIGWEGKWGAHRKFPVDMAAFSVGLELLLKMPQVKFQYSWPPGNLETRFLESLALPLEEFTVEPDANCSQVLAWHTRTVKYGKLNTPKVRLQNETKGQNSISRV